ncbi:unnamed protein product [Candidula unifasciata]|uniref:Angiotensin-converting enzyme n=1 Tax=Candidula unifasciata TaxID=100452 RepID=A0A8S3ZJG2_9EUPU|nr:unnamed protein product [Candidula unifasciata]
MNRVVQQLVLVCVLSYFKCDGQNNNEEKAKAFLREFNDADAKAYPKLAEKNWEYTVNMNANNDEQSRIEDSKYAIFRKEMRARALTFNASVMSADIQRQLLKISNIGVAVQPDAMKYEQLFRNKRSMYNTYLSAEVCLPNKNCLKSEQEVSEAVAQSRDYNELLNLWVSWRNSTGRLIRDKWRSGNKDYGEMWRARYESRNLMLDLSTLFEKVRPIYVQLHAFVRKRLKQFYGKDKFPKSGQIPAHLLGDLWSERWDHIYDLVVPFKNKTAINITSALIQQGYTPRKMFESAEQFYTSLGFGKMVPTFWSKSVFEEPKDGRRLMCQPGAWDSGNGDDFRVRMCAKTTQDHFLKVHHLMGHIVYMMQYKSLPRVYRQATNDAFNEAIADFVALSIQTPHYLKTLNLIETIPTDTESDLNLLMKTALQKLAPLAYGYTLERFRWNMFCGEIKSDQYNTEWWNYRCKHQGISPPVPRSELDFDLGARQNVAGDTEIIQFFLGTILQFQIHKAACVLAKFNGPIHRCDVYNKRQVGDKLIEIMKLGSSQPWQTVLQQLTGRSLPDALPVVEYFKPLTQFLRRENGDDFGWKEQCSQT